MLVDIAISFDADPSEWTINCGTRASSCHCGSDPRLPLCGDVGKNNRVHQDARDAFGLWFVLARLDPIWGVALFELRWMCAEQREGVRQPLKP